MCENRRELERLAEGMRPHRAELSAAPPQPPATEGELYDRLKALASECELLAQVVSLRVANELQGARRFADSALRLWMAGR